jgi:hypothetical protein
MQVSLLLVRAAAVAVEAGFCAGACVVTRLSTESDCPWLPTPTAEPPRLELLLELFAVAVDFADDFAAAAAAAPAEARGLICGGGGGGDTLFAVAAPATNNNVSQLDAFLFT